MKWFNANREWLQMEKNQIKKNGRENRKNLDSKFKI